MKVSFESFEIAEILHSKLNGTNNKIDTIMLNSKEKSINNGCFFALKGNKYDGNYFIDEAIKNGAKLIITNKNPNIDIPYILVNEPKIALGLLGKYNKRNTKVIAITGSNGKTTTKEMIKTLLLQKYNVCATKVNENNEIGVAKTLLSIKNHDFCIIEMGMRNLGEIEYLASISEPNISIITNCGSAHLENLKTQDNIFKAKTELVPYTKEFVLIPNEDRFRNINFHNSKPIFIGENGDFEIKKYSIFNNGIKFSVKDNNSNMESEEMYINLLGYYNAQNALNSYVIAKLLGLNENEIKNGFNCFKNCNLRGNIDVVKNITIIEDCYNSSYESMKNAILSLTEYSSHHKKNAYMLVGDMLEIGEGEDEYHFRIGEYAKDLGVKNIFSYGNKSKYILDGFCGGINFKNEEEIVSYILNNLGKNDILLVKASRNMHFENIISKLKA